MGEAMIQLSRLEQIAQDVESWGDGWKWLWNPDDHGNRARLIRQHSPEIDIEVEIVSEPNWFGVFVKTLVSTPDQGRRAETVSCNVRNDVTRKALDYINAQLDELAAIGREDDDA